MKKFFALTFLTLCFNYFTQAQTVGLFSNDTASFNGYTLFAPSGRQDVYLIDNCGKLVHNWAVNSQPGLMVYLLENGNLLHTGRVANATFNGGGQGGRLSLYDWNSNLLWSYTISSTTELLHHDVEPMPNGNILVIAWESFTKAEAIAQGHNPATVGPVLWPDKIMELKPIGTDSAEIVWEWHAWDHMIQDYDNTKPNYGVVADHPELLDLNFFTVSNPVGVSASDWMHVNAVDYNAELDQIVLSAHHWGEFWIIDHSTTTAEAATHSGGNSGKGGDILYRWGNPRTYGRGTVADQKLFNQHDAHWIVDGSPGAGNILIFNNGTGRPDSSYSTVDEVVVPVDSNGNYQIVGNNPYGPADPVWTFQSNPTDWFYSHNISGAQRQPNGTTLICEGSQGHFFEVDTAGNIVWEYINPASTTGIINQNNNPVNNQVFRSLRYPVNYPAFQGKNLTPGPPIEGNPLPYVCNITPEDTLTTSAGIIHNTVTTTVFPNPVNDILTVEMGQTGGWTITILDMTGRSVFQGSGTSGNVKIPTGDWAPGLFFVKIDRNLAASEIKKIIKQ